jgi:hypothetical protein
MSRIGSLALHKRVFKVGRRSNETYGFVNRVATTKLFGWRYSNGELIYDYGKAWVVMDRTVDDDERIKQRSGVFLGKGRFRVSCLQSEWRICWSSTWDVPREEYELHHGSAGPGGRH